MTPRSLVHRFVLSRLVQDVSIGRLRHSTKSVYVAEGYGGKSIEFFPPYRFFVLHERGQKDEARARFQDWYRHLFRAYWNVGKKEGGLRNGSLYRLVLEEHQRAGLSLPSDASGFRDELVDNAIARRVDQRFDFLSAIRDKGFVVQSSDLVVGVTRSKDVIYLNGGHHRAAALRALGIDTMPGMLVLSPRERALLRMLKIV